MPFWLIPPVRGIIDIGKGQGAGAFINAFNYQLFGTESSIPVGKISLTVKIHFVFLNESACTHDQVPSVSPVKLVKLLVQANHFIGIIK